MVERPASPGRPRIEVVGLGPAGPELLTTATARAFEEADVAYLRTARHPAAEAYSALPSFDRHYEAYGAFEDVYRAIAEELVAAAVVASGKGRSVLYAVPGSPVVAERSVELLVEDPRVAVSLFPALSFVDLAWTRLALDPLQSAVTVVDAADFTSASSARPGPFLVAQCWSKAELSSVKLAVEGDLAVLPAVTVLHHLGLDDEEVAEVPFAELDHFKPVDHLTSLFVPSAGPAVGAEMAALDALAAVLRRECPWDRQQTHRSLRRHLLEEAYEVLDALDDLEASGEAPGPGRAADHLAEELGDLLFQVVFHARLADEEGLFTLAHVAGGVHDKLVARHPHVFGDVEAATAEDVARNWEVIKAAEKGRRGVLDGVTWSQPALSLAQEVERKARRAGLVEEVPPSDQAVLEAAGPLLEGRDNDDRDAQLGRLLLALSAGAGSLGVDAELALRQEALRWAERLRAVDEAPKGAEEQGGSPNR